MKSIEINTEFIKLDQFLKYIGFCQTGSEAKILIKEGRIKVNGEIETRRGKKLKKGDIVEGEGVRVVINSKRKNENGV